ncbi:hypothetical protein SAMN05216577_1097 [Pseudomonas citronellolis]|jgi:uncharacterized membrane protein YedE/YeeE|uniref:YeeE/YedE family protein n=1 Tax=Pseudomonas citronellolis TaxID=53408 RepID=A0AAQ1KF50_9PSED|nr:DUF6691 family protein [Pseudomonas citronellolis]MCP1608143.1 putative membrane protein YedE/YeeE [Pseudomonas citronellolis]MCP1658907.1 putative membrane protein YedE/YeeE [Pseudomonas citronellolis]MCP1725849.1 putative membrane protein YedE/YeeE [Pseudomonas citronellolis]TGC30736.1 hypothetical protein CW310_06770 [Pseudomonas citronellolis]WRT80827.1 DUF6691 family protein [Pseudomonas citronellolis]
MARLSAFLCGLLFGLGLLLAGMADPAKVLAFLDLAGAWDPSLALVMVGAILTALPFFGLARGKAHGLLGGAMQLPTRRDLDRRLVLGSLVFGIGWGIAGICPGPALVGLGAGHWQAALFVLGMLAGMAAFEWQQRRKGAGA